MRSSCWACSSTILPGPRCSVVASGLRVPDLLPPCINAIRAFVTIGVVELIWIVTAWPNGAGAIAFATIPVVIFAPRAEQAYATAKSYLIGIIVTAALAAIVNFAVLPGLTGFTEFSIAWPCAGAGRRAADPDLADSNVPGDCVPSSCR